MMSGYHSARPALQCLIYIIWCLFSEASLICEKDAHCGWNAQCVKNQCLCLQGFQLSENNRDCVDTHCTDPKCLECFSSNPDTCRRCIGFVEEKTGVCVDNCNDYYKFLVEGSQVGKVCPVKEQMWTPTYIAIIIGVVAGVLLICLVALACYWKLKSDKERKLRFEVLNKQMNKDHTSTKVKTQKNISQDSISPPNRGRHLTMAQHMSSLRRQTDTLVEMYQEAKAGIRRLPVDNRTCVRYRKIAYHLTKVLALLRDPDPQLTSDSPALLEWAVMMVQDYRRYKQELELQTSSTTHHSVTPGSSLTRLTSAFQTDHILSNGHVPGDVSPSTTTMSFTYERSPGSFSTFQRDRELGEIGFVDLQDGYTDPVDV